MHSDSRGKAPKKSASPQPPSIPAARDRREGAPRTDPRAWVKAAVPLVVLLVLAAGLRLFQLARSPLWYDEVMYTLLARTFHPEVATAGAVRIEPLFYLFLWAWEKVSVTDIWIRLHAVAAGTLAVALAYRIGGHVAGRRGAWFFSGLCAVAPFLVFYSRDAKMYSWLAFLELAALWLALRHSERRGDRACLAGYAVCAVALVHTHILSALYLAALNAAFVVVVPMPWRKRAVWCLAQGMVVVLCLPYLWTQWRLAASMQEVVFWVPPPDLRSLWTACGNLLFGYAPGSTPRLAFLVLAALMAAAGLLAKGPRRRWVAVAVLAGALNMLAFYLLSRFGRWSFFVDRYMIGTLPLWLLAVAAGMASVRPMPVRGALVAGCACLSGLGLAGLYGGVLSPDMRDHLGIIRSVDTRAMAEQVRRHAENHRGGGETVWHVSWETFLTAKWYMPEARHMAVEMAGELNQAMDRDEIACRRAYYDATAVPLETAAAGTDHVWIVLPESEAPIYPRFRGFQAWLEARGARVEHQVYPGGRMAPSSLNLYAMGSGAPEPEQATDLPVVTAFGTGRLGVSAEPGPPPFLRTSVTGTKPTGVHCIAQAGECVLGAADFDRRLGPASRWVLQLYQGTLWPRIAFRNAVGPGAPAGDVLSRRVTLSPGLYDVLVERLAGGDGPLAAPLQVTVGGVTLTAGALPGTSQGDWKWERVGACMGDGKEMEVLVCPFNPGRRPEVIPVFSGMAFVRRTLNDAERETPVVLECDVPGLPEPTKTALPPTLPGRHVRWLAMTMEQCAQLDTRSKSVTLPDSPAPVLPLLFPR